MAACCSVYGFAALCLEGSDPASQHMECIKVFPTFSFFVVQFKPETTDTCENKPSLDACSPVLSLCLSYLQPQSGCFLTDDVITVPRSQKAAFLAEYT